MSLLEVNHWFAMSCEWKIYRHRTCSWYYLFRLARGDTEYQLVGESDNKEELFLLGWYKV